MRFMHLVRIGIEIGKILFVKNHQVKSFLNFLCLNKLQILKNIKFFFLKTEAPGPISNAGISITKNGVTRLLRRGKYLI